MKNWKLIRTEKETIPNCSLCGTKIKYVAWIKNIETLEEIPVGSVCCSNMLSHGDNKAIKNQINRIKVVDKCKSIIEKYGDKHTDKEIGQYLYNQLAENMKDFFPRYYKVLFS